MSDKRRNTDESFDFVPHTNSQYRDRDLCVCSQSRLDRVEPRSELQIGAAMKRGFQTRDGEMDLARLVGEINQHRTE
jgi:hypothetical protein